MIRNYIFTALRSIVRQKGNSLINILGLTLGFFVSFLILFYVFDELSFDKFHRDSERIYRLVFKGTLGEMPLNAAVSPKALAWEIINNVPEAEDATVFDIESTSFLLSFGENKIYERDFLYADTSFLRIFNFPLIYGDKTFCLTSPYSILVSETFSKKYYKSVNPVGEIIKLNEQQDYIITGVFKDIPDESHLGFNFLISMSSKVMDQGEEIMQSWGELNSYTYVKIHENANMQEFQSKLDTILFQKVLGGEEGVNVDLKIVPQLITEIHLHSDLLGEIKENGDVSYIFVLLAIACGIILIASINFMNLSTAKSANRAKEVGIRKILGSQKSMLIGQFIGESVIVSLISFMLALSLIEIALPFFNEITGKNLGFSFMPGWSLFLFLGIALITGFLAGSYPAFYLSSFQPIKVLQNRMNLGKSGNLKLRNLLVFIQFTISTGLIICTLIIYLQLNYLKTKDLGFDKQSVISIEMRNPELRENAKILKEEISKIAGVESVSLSTTYPGRGLRGSSFTPEGTNEKDPWIIFGFHADEDFIQKTMGMKILRGRDFSNEFGSDTNAVLINETLYKRLGWSDPIGKKISNTFQDDSNLKMEYHVIGVVADFHFQSLHESVDPIMIHLLKGPPQVILVRMDPRTKSQTIKNINEGWSRLNPDHPFEYDYLNDFFDNFYYSEKRIGRILIYLTLFAIFIASIGLLGLASFTAEQRTKEIGIRKVMGASPLSISFRLTMEYLKMIGLAGIVAWPVSYYLIYNWLEKFSYRTEIPVWVFVSATGITTILSLIVVNFQTIKAANSNPVKSLRYE